MTTSKLTPTAGGKVIEAVVGQPNALNPVFEANQNATDIDSLIYQGLTSTAPDETLVPLLAKSWSISGDGTVYTLPLHSGVRWADGSPFSADDVMFTYGVLQSQDYKVAPQQSWKDVKVEKVDALTVRFTLKAPSAAFPVALRLGIIPQHLFQNVPIPQMELNVYSGEKAIGTGPFKVESLSKDHRDVVLTRNRYARPRPYLDQFEFRGYPDLASAASAVSSGEADAVGAPQPLGSLARRPDLVLHDLRTYNVAAVLFNVNSSQASFFANQPGQSVRQALSMAVNRSKLVNDKLEGKADIAYGPIPPADWAYSQGPAGKLSYNTQQAGKLLDGAGWPMNPATNVRQNGQTPLSVSLVTSDQPPYGGPAGVAEDVAGQLKLIGVNVTVQFVSAEALVSQYVVPRQFQMAMAIIDNGPDPDQYSWWHSGAAQDTLSLGGLLPKQALIDKDLEDGRAEATRKDRRATYGDYQDLMAAAAPAIFLFSPHYEYLVSSRVRGVRTNPVVEPVDRFEYVASWWVKATGT